MKRCSTLLVIREMQMKTIIKYHFTLINMGYLTLFTKTNKQKKTHFGEDVEKLESLCITGGKVKWYSCCGKQYNDSPNYTVNN